MTTADPHLLELDRRERADERGDIPSRADLLRAWLHGGMDIDTYALQMNRYYPMTAAEVKAAVRTVHQPIWWLRIASKREAERGQ